MILSVIRFLVVVPIVMFALAGSAATSNQPPVAVDDNADIARGVTTTIDVLANDSDPENDALTVTTVGAATQGTAALGSGGANVTYTPNADFLGTDTFDYTVSDGHGNTATATVTVILPNAITPTSLKVTVKSVDLQTKDAGPFRLNLFKTEHTADVVGSGSGVGGLFASTDLYPGKFTGVQFTFATSAQFSGIDPCTGDQATDADVRLAANNGLDDVLVYEEPHPVLGLAKGAVTMDPFTADGNTPATLRLVFPVTNSVVCLSDEPPLFPVSGSDTNLAKPFGITEDAQEGDYVVTNSAANRVTFHSLGDIKSSQDGNVLPHYTIVGTDTQLNTPTGVAVNDAGVHQVAVSNNGNDTITVYNREDFPSHPDGNVPPSGTLSGPDTQLSGPGGVYVDHTQNQLVVANGSGNSIAFYNLDTNGLIPVGDTAPYFLLTGNLTGLDAPCGVQVDGSGNVYVVNNHGNSVTEYQRSAFAPDSSTPPQVNLAPMRFIQGPHTEIIAPCGIALDTRQSPPAVAVSSSTAGEVLFFNPTDSGDAYPARVMRGDATGIVDPLGLAIDENATDETGNTHPQIAIADNQNNTLSLYGIADSDFMPHLHDAPSLRNDSTQQTIYVRYFFGGNLSNVGQPVNTVAASGAPPLPVQFAGYTFAWQIVDDRLRQQGDANSARLIPPENVVWGLADGSVVSSLALACPSFQPFTTLTLFTNCSQPLVTSPFPAAVGDYRLIAALLGSPTIKKITLYEAPMRGDQIPRLALTVHIRDAVLTNGSPADTTIQGMDWVYEDGTARVLAQDEFPLIKTQSVQINLTRPYSDVDPCYQQTAGNSSSLVYSSPTMGRNVRTLLDITNNSCPIRLSDIDNILFTATDAVGTNYIYQLRPTP